MRAAPASFAKRFAAPSSVAASPVGRDVTTMVETRVADYIRHFERADASRLRRLACPGRHIRECAGDAQRARPDRRFCPHRAPRRQLRGSRGSRPCRRARSRPPTVCSPSAACGATGSRGSSVSAPHLVGNGVDIGRFSPVDGCDRRGVARALEAAGRRKVFLAIGGVEKRKNTVRILEAFRIVHAAPSVIAPGDRGRRLAARPRCLSGRLCGGAGGERPAGAAP